MDPASQLHWSERERARLAEHIQSEIERLGAEERLAVSVVPEPVFARDSSLQPLLGSHKVLFTGEWSIWLREALEGVPLQYNLLIETAIHELAHTLVARAELYGETRESRLRSVDAALLEKATRLGIWPKSAVPSDVRDLF